MKRLKNVVRLNLKLEAEIIKNIYAPLFKILKRGLGDRRVGFKKPLRKALTRGGYCVYMKIAETLDFLGVKLWHVKELTQN